VAREIDPFGESEKGRALLSPRGREKIREFAEDGAFAKAVTFASETPTGVEEDTRMSSEKDSRGTSPPPPAASQFPTA